MDFLSEYQSLIGSLVTLGAAFIGFTGVIYSQRNEIKQAEAHRLHQERLSKEHAELELRNRLLSYLSAMMGEVASLGKSIDQAIQVVNAQISITEEMVRGGAIKKTQPRVSFKFITPVFDSHISQIGLLTPDLSFKVSSLYGQFKNFNSQDQSQVPEMELGIAIKVMKSVVTSLTQLGNEAKELRAGLENRASEVSRH